MGRGRKGPMDQSQKKPKVSWISRERAEVPMAYFNAPNDDKKILFLSKDAVKTFKKINPEQLVNFLLPNDDWHMKTLNGNASGSWLNILDMQIQAFLYKREAQNISCGTSQIFLPLP